MAERKLRIVRQGVSRRAAGCRKKDEENKQLSLLQFELDAGSVGLLAAQQSLQQSTVITGNSSQGGRAHHSGSIDVGKTWKDLHQVAKQMQGEEWKRRVISVVAGQVDLLEALLEDIASQLPELTYELFNISAPGKKDRDGMADQTKRERMVLRSHLTASLLAKQANSHAVPLLSGILGCWFELQHISEV